jgi:hypothetical protein
MAKKPIRDKPYQAGVEAGLFSEAERDWLAGGKVGPPPPAPTRAELDAASRRYSDVRISGHFTHADGPGSTLTVEMTDEAGRPMNTDAERFLAALAREDDAIAKLNRAWRWRCLFWFGAGLALGWWLL